MRDTSFVVETGQIPRFAANYQRQADGGLALIDDPRRASTGSARSSRAAAASSRRRRTTSASPPCSETTESWTGCAWSGRKTLELMTMNHLPGGQDLTQLAQAGMFTETAGPAASTSWGAATSLAGFAQ
jgi:hypothetical protein